MKEITLHIMTRELCHQYFMDFQMDPALFMDESKYQPYVYNEKSCDAYFDRYVSLGRVHLAIMLGNIVIGELVLKGIDPDARCCTMGICMQKNAYKNKGYGTAAERLALEYAFDIMGMETVYADSLKSNKRSQHVLEKVGFIETHEDAFFRFYRCDRPHLG